MRLPDSRTNRIRKNASVKVCGREYVQTFCANCGCKGGCVIAEIIPFVFYICDDCTEKYGRIDAPELAEDIARGV